MHRTSAATDLTRACKQLLSRLKPYHTIKDDFVVSNAIVGGLVPSLKPEKPYAPPCLNEHLWNVVRSCWSQLDFRPTATRLLNQLNTLMEQKLVDTSPITPERNSIDFNGTLPDWPVKIEDFESLRGGAREEVISSSDRAEVRMWVKDFDNSLANLTEFPDAMLRANHLKLSIFLSLTCRLAKAYIRAPGVSALRRISSRHQIHQGAKAPVQPG